MTADWSEATGDSSRSAVFPTAHTVIYEGPAIGRDSVRSQFAWGNNGPVVQTQTPERVSPGLETIARTVAHTLEGLAAIGLTEEDRRNAEDAGAEVLGEAAQNEPDRSRIQRALSVLKGVLALAATGLVAGSAEGAQEWARTAIERLSMPFS
ncbi:hypothetical protein [Streptomyces sp. NPDC057199]|uniref:hypothetical protein n=1 Tax=Streptomyces sp. NPDC057199 TaxID=3346047 RepID=UPI003632CF92